MTTNETSRTITVGTSKEGGKVTVTINLRTLDKGTELSITGNVWMRSGRDITTGGQIQNRLLDEIATFSVPREKVERLIVLWNRWHLNGMNAGCEHQRAEGWADRPIDPSKPTNADGKHYDGQLSDSWNMLAWVSRSEHPEGLLSHPCPTCGYKYGTAWLFEAIPAGVLAELAAWPE